jgi:hypothetical protein
LDTRFTWEGKREGLGSNICMHAQRVFHRIICTSIEQYTIDSTARQCTIIMNKGYDTFCVILSDARSAIEIHEVMHVGHAWSVTHNEHSQASTHALPCDHEVKMISSTLVIKPSSKSCSPAMVRNMHRYRVAREVTSKGRQLTRAAPRGLKVTCSHDASFNTCCLSHLDTSHHQCSILSAHTLTMKRVMMTPGTPTSRAIGR